MSRHHSKAKQTGLSGFVLGCFFLGKNYFSEAFLVLFLLLWSAEDVPALWYEIDKTEV